MESGSQTVVTVHDLHKSYGANHVLNGVSFSVKRGEIFALLGVNGAGKSTTFECIEGVRRYEGGRIDVNGSIGVQLQTSSLMPECKVKEAVRLFSLWRKVPEIDMASFGIAEIQDKKYKALSGGQKKRVHLALAMIGDPDIIILDEPTAGLDVEGQVELHQEIRKLRDAGKTILLASHDMAEVDELCDRMAILRGGLIAFLGTPSELKESSYHGGIEGISLMIKASAALPEVFTSCVYKGVEQGYYKYNTEHVADALYEILNFAREKQILISDVQIKHPSLEQRFMEISKEA